MTLEIEYIQETPEEIENKSYNELIENFNKLAKEKKIKIRIRMSYGYPHLSEKTWFFENYSNQIVLLHDGTFTFTDELNKEVFESIKDILEKIPQKFKIKLIKENS